MPPPSPLLNRTSLRRPPPIPPLPTTLEHARPHLTHSALVPHFMHVLARFSFDTAWFVSSAPASAVHPESPIPFSASKHAAALLPPSSPFPKNRSPAPSPTHHNHTAFPAYAHMAITEACPNRAWGYGPSSAIKRWNPNGTGWSRRNLQVNGIRARVGVRVRVMMVLTSFLFFWSSIQVPLVALSAQNWEDLSQKGAENPLAPIRIRTMPPNPNPHVN